MLNILYKLTIITHIENCAEDSCSSGCIGYNLIRFGGKDNSGKPLELIQHVSQLDFLLTVA
ncbi:DUF6173 family protein [Enterocloster bolteae]|uniref:DUF6173 family protein n=1 Tax=Enterocloster bolteae TaxID=208479 RepID=UPI0039EFEE2D